MVEQIRRLGIPTSGLVDGSQITQRSKVLMVCPPLIIVLIMRLLVMQIATTFTICISKMSCIS
jgi:hypothetical protein